MRIARALLAAALAGLLAAPAAPAELKVLDEDPLAVQAKQGEEAATGALSVLNTGPQSLTATVDLQAETLASVACAGRGPVAAGKAARITITCSGLKQVDKPVKGQLVVAGAEAPAVHAVAIAPALDSTAWALGLIVAALLVAGALVVGVWRWAITDTERKGHFHGRAPGPKWDFADSWATTLTTVGALLATVLTGLTYPEAPRHIDEDTLLALSVLFAALVVIAPFLFQAARHADAPVAGDGSTLWGSNRALLLCCGLTYAAVLGQLATAALLCFELTGGGVEGWAVVVGAVLLGGAATRYFVLTTSKQADTDWATITREAEAETAVAAPEGGLATVRIPVPRAPLRWSLP